MAGSDRVVVIGRALGQPVSTVRDGVGWTQRVGLVDEVDQVFTSDQFPVGAGLQAVLLDRRDEHPSHSPRIRTLDELRL